MSDNQSMSKQAITLIVARGISFLVTLIIPLVFVRYLSQVEFGAYKQSILLYTTFYNLLPWGMAQSLYYFIPKEPERRKGYLANSFIFLMMAGLLACIGLSFSGPLLQNYFHSSELAGSSGTLGLYILFMISSNYAEVALVAENRTSAAAWVILSNEVAKVIALAGSAYFTHCYTGIMVGLATAASIRFVLMTFYFRDDLKNISKGFDLPLLRNQLHYSLPFGMMVLLTFVQDYFHQYYISYSFSPKEFAIYAVGILELPLVDLFYTSIGDVSMVKMAESLREKNKERMRLTWHAAMIKLAVIFFPMTVYMFVISHQLITALYTDRYAASVPIFKFTLLAMPLTILLVDAVLRVFGETRYLLLISALRLPFTIAFVIVALSIFGMIGGVISTITMLLIVRTTLLIRISKLMEVGIKDLLPWRKLGEILIAALTSALPTVLLLHSVKLEAKLALFVTAPVYGLTLLIVGNRLDIFPSEEKELITELILKIWKFITLRPIKVTLSKDYLLNKKIATEDN